MKGSGKRRMLLLFSSMLLLFFVSGCTIDEDYDGNYYQDEGSGYSSEEPYLADSDSEYTYADQNDSSDSNDDESFPDNAAAVNLTRYDIQNGSLSDPYYYDLTQSQYQDEQDDMDTQADLWNLATRIFPAAYSQKLDQLIFYTDGPENDLAMVEPLHDDTGTQWILYIDMVDAQDTPELKRTLTHELGHLLLVNPGDFNTSYGVCDTYESEFGCFSDSSPLGAFIHQFWTDILAEWQDIEYNTTTQEDFDDQIYTFYETYQDQFVNDYAATNPEEDFAETWLYYVFEMQPDGGEIAQEKIDFFAQYPQWVQIAEQIRANSQ